MSDLARLKSQLATSGLQTTNQAQYQVISQLIDAVQAIPGPTAPFVITLSTVASLPTPFTKSAMFYVNDALAPAVGAIVAGGGAAFAAVMWNGTNWRVFSV
jgi:hypothetical protein